MDQPYEKYYSFIANTKLCAKVDDWHPYLVLLFENGERRVNCEYFDTELCEECDSVFMALSHGTELTETECGKGFIKKLIVRFDSWVTRISDLGWDAIYISNEDEHKHEIIHTIFGFFVQNNQTYIDRYLRYIDAHYSDDPLKAIASLKIDPDECDVETALKITVFIDKYRPVKYLNLYGRGITELPESVFRLKNLENLNIAGNKLRNIPECIDQLTNLNCLFANDNNLTDLPHSIGNLNNLTVLFVQNNLIRILPKSIHRLKHLERLELNNNQLMFLRDSICELDDLRILEVSGNMLMWLPSNIDRMLSLTHLDASDNAIRSLPKTFSNLADSVWVVNIDLSRNPLGKDAIEILKNMKMIIRKRMLDYI